MNPTPTPPATSDKIRVQIDASIEQLIPTFLANRRRDVDTLRRALAEGDYPVIQTLGHRMKGDGGGYGFNGISEVGATLEAAAIRKDRDSIDRQTSKLVDYLDRLDIVFVE